MDVFSIIHELTIQLFSSVLYLSKTTTPAIASLHQGMHHLTPDMDIGISVNVPQKMTCTIFKLFQSGDLSTSSLKLGRPHHRIYWNEDKSLVFEASDHSPAPSLA
jgi:hypothetical protein